jgi:anthranilate phosphoribosyltransferase
METAGQLRPLEDNRLHIYLDPLHPHLTPTRIMSDGTFSLHGILKKISTNLAAVTPDDIAEAISRISQDQCSAVQTGALLTAMHYTGLDMKADVIAAATEAMRRAGLQIHGLKVPPQPSGVRRGTYKGGLVDIVGTGGDGHDTFNVSTTAAIVAAGCGIRICTGPPCFFFFFFFFTCGPPR